MLPLIVSYYTLGTGYEDEVKNLIHSCQHLGLHSDIVGIASQGSWEQNCCYKPRFLLEKLKQYQRPIVWVDADAIILKSPTLFENLDCDIALRIYDELPLEHPSKLITGTLYLQNRPSVFELLKLWEAECQKMLREKTQEVWDQIALKRVLLQGLEIALFPLPDTYCAIYDKSLTPKDEAIILHFQASRLLKKVINKEVVPFWENTMFSQENRKKFSS